MGQPARLEKQPQNQTFAVAPGFCACWSSRVNTLANFAGELNELIGQNPAKGSNAGSDKTFIESPPEAPTPPLIPFISENFFTKFMKVFMETTQAQDQLELWEFSLKARTPKTYVRKSNMDCYHFYQQCEDYFNTFGATEMNCTLFAATFLRSFISLRWA